MISYLTRRLLWIIPVLFAVSVITFGLMHAVPGGPWAREKQLPAAVERRLNAQYGLDKPIYEQYLAWAGGFVTGDLGPSYRYQDRSVNEIVADGFWITFQLGIMAFGLSVLVGIPLGIIAALGHNRWPDYLTTSVAIIGIATPSFVLAIMLIIFFSVAIRVVPDRGLERPRVLGASHDRAGRLPDRGDRALHASLHAGGDAQGLHPDRAQQGVAEQFGGHPAHDPQRADPGGDDPRADAGLPRHGLVHHRARLQHPGDRASST